MRNALGLIGLVVVVLTGCSDESRGRSQWAIDLRNEFQQAYIYAEGDENRTLVVEMDCERMFSWPQVGSLNNRGFRELKCRELGTTKTYDLNKPLPIRAPSKEEKEPTVEHDYGCPVAAARLIKKMKGCDLSTDGITEDVLCGKSSPIDSKVVRMVSNSSSCDELMRSLGIKQ